MAHDAFIGNAAELDELRDAISTAERQAERATGEERTFLVDTIRSLKAQYDELVDYCKLVNSFMRRTGIYEGAMKSHT